MRKYSKRSGSGGAQQARPIPDPMFETGMKTVNDPEWVTVDPEDCAGKCRTLLETISTGAVLVDSFGVLREDPSVSSTGKTSRKKLVLLLTDWEREFLADTLTLCTERPGELTGKHVVTVGKLYRRCVNDTRNGLEDL